MKTENSLLTHDHDSETYEESIFQMVWCKYFSNFGYEYSRLLVKRTWTGPTDLSV